MPESLTTVDIVRTAKKRKCVTFVKRSDLVINPNFGLRHNLYKFFEVTTSLKFGLRQKFYISPKIQSQIKLKWNNSACSATQ